MSWENYGKVWQIDHITPLNYRIDNQNPTLEEIIERLHWTNTQAMYNVENMSKGNKYIG